MKLNKMASRREFVEQMPTQGLDAMLQAELQKETIDEDLVRLILDVLESREMDCPVEYIPEAVEAARKLEDIGPRTTAKGKYPQVFKAASILLVAGLLLFALPRVAHAENLFVLLARWTDSVFEFFNPGEPNDQPEYVFKSDHPGLQQTYDAVVEMGVTDPVVPMWIPNEYIMTKCKKVETSRRNGVRALFEDQTGEIIITIDIFHSDIERFYNKDGTSVEEMEFDGTKHYLFSNNEKQIVTWVVNNVECSIIVDCQEDDLYKILKSIYVMEDYN